MIISCYLITAVFQHSSLFILLEGTCLCKALALWLSPPEDSRPQDSLAPDSLAYLHTLTI
jgi:hypothetical protein